MSVTPTIENVVTEGAEIYCERRGKGTLLLLIAGAMGDTRFYSSAADKLASEFTVVCYDRRCNSRSSGDRTNDMTVAQRARDAYAIIQAMGTDKAIVFGSSGGAIIGLELAATRPEVIDFLIAHEPGVIDLIAEPEGEKWSSFHRDIFTKSQHEGWRAALPAFMASLVNVPNAPYPPDLNARVEDVLEFFFEHEYMQFIHYIPDIERIRNNNVNMVVAIGKDSDGAYYVHASNAFVSKLGCEKVEFPGHHDVSFWMPEEFANAIRLTLDQHGYEQRN
jgi:pimeloyl-ACP methyl ester carboxylesterase